jgi:uncharacterized CHY-type Zn-finger protein
MTNDIICDECDEHFTFEGYNVANYCPNCGCDQVYVDGYKEETLSPKIGVN